MSQPTGGMFVCRGRPCPLLHFWISRTQHWLRQLSWFWHQINLHICRGMALEHSSAEWGTSLYPSYWPLSDTFTAESRSRQQGTATIIHFWRSNLPGSAAAGITCTLAHTDVEDFPSFHLHLIYAAITDYSFSRAKESWSIFCARQ